MSPHYQRDTLIGFILLIYSLVACSTVLAVDQVISEQEGKTVIVPCPVNREKCGELHSLNWFKGDNRIAAMLLDDSNVTSVAAEFEDRVSVEQNPFRLIIRNLRISDEDIYLCDTTYFIPIETCDNFNGHRVELNVLVPPTEVVILDEKGDRIDNGSIVGPIQERQILKSTCIVRNTRPQPQVGWWRGNKRLTTHSPSYDEQNGLFTATLELSLQLSRDDLGHNIECRVDSAAIPNTLKNQFSVDLQVRPTSITINGVEHHTVQGSKVVLTCDIHGARPPVNLTWYNNTQPISSEDNDISEIRTKAFGKEDGTYHTQSELIFNATRFENDMVFRCEAENIVLQINREKPFTSSMTLEVLYPPVVKVSPLDITVNTSDTVLLNCEYVANPASLTHVVWYRNGDMVNVNDTERYEGGNSENVALVIRSTDKQDIGNYSCQLSNVIGKGISEQQTDLDVQFVPIVEVLMIPEGPVKESDESNVTLFCNILDANPSILSKVRWYANSTLLKELPDCEETREDLCHIDPSKLLLESIGRGFFYNYSCEGYNAAGWGTRSDDKELLVHYEPGPAVVTHFPLIAVKKKSVTFSCSVDDPGYPESNRYRWLRGGRGPLQDVVTKDWTVEPVGLDSRTNYSCYAFNEGGKGVMATVNLEVHAPPFFIKNLPPYTGMLHTSRNANLTCRIECVPRCEISWLKDGVPIDKNDTRYFVKDKYMDASPATGDFESMLSVLHFNMSNWPNKKFDIEGDNANYTCVSTGNTVGPGIKSATYFSIEYAPDNTTVSEEVVYVQEETIPGRVICKSRANPEPTYEWLHNNKTVIRGNALIINTSMMRNDTGRYTCAAFNKHGRNTAETFIDVQYKPRCEIERREIDDRDTLICTAYGNPEEADFSWSIKAENESVEWLGSGDNKASKDKSFYILTEDYAIARTYRCVANNTAGAGQFCEVEVAEQLAWWQRWDKTTLIILVASILVLLLAVIIICCIIICICRRRRRQDKYRTDASMSANHSVLSYQPSAAQVVPGINTGGGASMATTILPDSLKVPIIPTAVIISKPVAGQEQHQRYQQSYQIIATPPITQIATLARSLLNVTKEQEPEQLKQTEIVFSSRNSDNNNANNNNNNSNNNNENTLAQTQLHTQPQQQTQPHNTSLESTSISNMKTHVATPTTTTPILSIRRNTNQAPKSPPRWPLRPGVMVHVRNDTKENLAVNRMTLKPNALLLPKLTAQGSITDSSFSSSALNASINTTQTTLLNGTQDSNLVDRRALNHDQQDDNSMTPTALKNETLRLTEQNPELEIRQLEAVSASNSAPIAERPIKPVKQTNYQRLRNLIANIFFKRSHPCNDDGIRDSQRSHVGLLGGKFWRKPEAGDKSPFAKEHRLKGIRSSGSVTYKKCAKRTTATTTTYSTCTVSATHHHNIANEFENNNINNNGTNHNNLVNNTQTSLYCTVTDSIISTKALTPVKVTAQLAPLTMQHQRPLPASAILIEPSLNISHPRLQNVTPGINNNNNVTNNNNTTTTVIQSIPSTIMSSRENRSNTVRNTNSNANNQKSTLKGILKSPTPPPRPAPPLLKRSVSHITTIQRHIEQVQIQEKSSSMADPLTEPGEYENLPFHGLQTAPNKFTTPTTPTNFNNNTNVVRSVPRPKRLNGNISQIQGQQQQQHPQYPHHYQQQQHQHAAYYDEQESETGQQQQQQYYHLQQQQQQQLQQEQAYNTFAKHTAQQQHQQQQPSTSSSILAGLPTIISQSNNSSTSNCNGRIMLSNAATEDGVIVHTNSNSLNANSATSSITAHNSASSITNPHQQMPYNLNNCFPKSYTEYYQTQQQQQQQQFTSKFAINNMANATHAQMLNAIEHDYNAFNAGVALVTEGNTKATNPFLAVSNFKKFNQPSSVEASTMEGYNTTSMKRIGKRKTFVDKLEDKRFYSLKFSSGGKNKAQNSKTIGNGEDSSSRTGVVGVLGPLITDSNNKCKRHHSFAGGSVGDIDPKGPSRNPLHFYDTPAYENVNDAVQVHTSNTKSSDMEMQAPALSSSMGTATVLLHPLPHHTVHVNGGLGASSTTGPKKKHHQRQHQPKEDLNLIEPERSSIYRSDSGISNSSYECVTPVPSHGAACSTPPPGKTPRAPKTPKTPKTHKTNSLIHSTVTANFNSAHKKQAPRVPPTPLYINVNSDSTASPISNLERPSSPNSAVATSAYESASSSQNDGTCADPASLSSCTSLYSGKVTSVSRCSRHQQPPEITTPEEYEQYQLGHHPHGGHSSSSLSVASSVSGTGVNASAWSKCKKQQRSTVTSNVTSLEPLSALNFDDELIYADLESQHYGPIDYKAASIYAQMKKNKQTGAVQELKQ